MTDPKPKPVPPRLVDENYTPPANPTPQEKFKADRASMLKEGRRREREEHGEAIRQMIVARTAAEEAIEAAHLKEIARLDERWTREERKHGSGRFWSGVSTGVMVMLAIGSVVAAVYTTQVMNASFDAAGEASARRDALEIVREAAERPPTTNEPRSESAP